MYKKISVMLVICLVLLIPSRSILNADDSQTHIKNRVKIIPKYGEGVKKIDYEEVKKMQERANLTPEQLKELEEKEAKEKLQKRIEEENKNTTSGEINEDKLTEELKSFTPPYTLEQMEKFRAHVDVVAQAKEISLKLLQKEHEDVLKETKYNDYSGSDRVTAIKRNKKKNIDPMISKSKLESERRNLKFHSLQERVNLEKLVADYQLGLFEKEFLAQKRDYIKKIYEADELRQSLGKITQVQVMESQNTLDEAQDKLQAQEDKIASILSELKRKLGFKLQDELLFTYEILKKEDLPEYLKERIKTAATNQPEVIEKSEKVEYTKLIFEDVRTYYRDFDKEYISAQADYKIALMEYNDAYNQALIGLDSDYEKMCNQAKLCELLTQALELKNKSYEHKTIEFSLGKISKLDLEKSKLDLMQARFNLEKEIVNYNNQRDNLYLKLNLSYD